MKIETAYFLGQYAEEVVIGEGILGDVYGTFVEAHDALVASADALPKGTKVFRVTAQEVEE